MLLFFCGMAVALLGCLGLLYGVGRWNEHAVTRDWDMMLSPRGAQSLEATRQRADDELSMADFAFQRADEARSAGSVGDAVRLIEVAYRVIERFSPKMTTLLRMMSVLSRMAAAMAPMPSLNPRRFKAPQLTGLALFNQFVHQFLASTAERFRLRTYVLSRGFGLAVRLLFHATDRAKRTGAAGPEWEQIHGLREDVHALTDESFASLRVLLASLGADWKDDGTLWVADE